MLFNRQIWHKYLFLIAAFSMNATLIQAQTSPEESLKDFVTSDVIGVAYVDIDNMDLGESVALLAKLGFKQTIRYQQMLEELPQAKEDVARMKKAGLSRAYALLRSSDIQAMGTSFVFPLSEGSDPQAAIEIIQEVVVKLSGGTAPNYQIDHRDGAIIASAASQFERLKNDKGEGSVDRSDIWSAIGKGSFGVVLFGDEDSRRVVRELMPALPPPFDALNGDLVADGTKWIGMSLKLDATPTLNIEIETSDEGSAKMYESVINDAMKMAKFLPQVRDVIPKSEIKFVFDAIAPKRNGNRVSISASQLTNDLDRLAKVLAPQVRAVRAAAVRTQKLNTIRQLMLGMLNYESAHRRWPTQYSASDDGKPLLSWRVHVLPFLDQNELYEKFKLNEPWDSEHNIKLVEQMPEIFWDMRSAALESNKAGETVFQVPAGEGLMFDGTNQVKFKDITDGSSNTIGLVALPLKNAVPWTKPTDWNVDLENPLEMLKAEGRTRAEVGICDGSVQSFSLKSPKAWRQLVGRADGELVNVNELD
jgi:hypothetical protein